MISEWTGKEGQGLSNNKPENLYYVGETGCDRESQAYFIMKHIKHTHRSPKNKTCVSNNSNDAVLTWSHIFFSTFK